jgi:hypothetical protein
LATAKTALYTARQPNSMPYETWLRRLTYLADNCGLDRDQVEHQFVASLKDAAPKHTLLLAGKGCTAAELVERLELAEQLDPRPAKREWTPRTPRSEAPRASERTTETRSAGTPAERPSPAGPPSGNAAQQSPQRTCYKCGEPGHVRASCPRKN